MLRTTFLALTLVALAPPSAGQDQRALVQLLQSQFPAATGRDAGAPIGPAGGNDIECNDVGAFADTLTVVAGGACTVNGRVSLAAPSDVRDVYRLVLTGGPEHEVVIAVGPTGSSFDPPRLTLADSGQRLIADGVLRGSAFMINRIKLPDGVYYVTLLATIFGGNYALTVTSTATTIPNVTNGTTGNFTLAPEIHTYRVVVGAPAERVHLHVTNATATDTGDYLFSLGRARGGRVLFLDDVVVPPATTASNDPVMDAELPAGTYYVFLQEFANAVVNAGYRISYGAVPIASVPNAIGANTYTMNHGGEFYLYSLSLRATDHFRLLSTRSVTTGDSFLDIFDREMGLVLFADDAVSPLTTSIAHAYADATLPAGQYWVLARNYSSLSRTNFTTPWNLTGTGGLPLTLAVHGNVGVGPLSMALGSHYAFTHTACTDTPMTAAHTWTNLSLVGADGLLRGYFRLFPTAGSESLVSVSLRANETVYGNLSTDSYGAITVATLHLAGKLGIELAPVSGTGVYSLRSEDKRGNMQALFLAVGSGPGFAIPPVTGRLCLDAGTLTFVGFADFTTSCRFTWPLPDLRPFIPPAAVPGIRFQALSVDAGFNGGFTNIAQ